MVKERYLDNTKLREARGNLTLADVGRRLGISRQQVWSYENGKNFPSLERLIMLLDLYDVRLESLLQTKYSV